MSTNNSPFHKISRIFDDDTLIKVRTSETINIKGITYRKANFDTQDGINHYLFDQEDCNKLCISNIWYCEVKPHKCVYNCKDSGQTDKQWIQYLRSLDPKDWRIPHLKKLTEQYGFSNTRKEGMIRID